MNSTVYKSSSGNVIRKVNSCKDLGVYFDQDGSFSTHIAGKISKSKKLSGYILRTFMTRSASLLMQLFKAIVLPIMEYGSVIWHPSKLMDIRAIESIQRNFTAKIFGLDDMNYWERLKFLKIYSLERRWERHIIIFTFKILYGRRFCTCP